MTTPNQPDRPRLIEVAFPLKQASLDSVHEKNVRHGHISTLHIWPARRPLAASRAALIATLLPDPGTAEGRRALVDRIGGRVVTGTDGKEHTEGGILHWGRESNPDLQWFREEIRKAYGGRAPRVMDPFAGGGAIPLEAMRLGCEVTAVDINPVAWFILKCTLEYPQRLAGQTRPLPDFVRADRDFLTAFFKARGLKGKALAAQVDRIVKGASVSPSPEADETSSLSDVHEGGHRGAQRPQPRIYSPGLDNGVSRLQPRIDSPGHKSVTSPQLAGMESADALPEADLAWHVRAWGAWVLERAKCDLAQYYPAVDGKPTVAYLWARTVTCKACRATIPLLKTRWLCKKEKKRIILTMEPNAERTGVVFGILNDAPIGKGSASQKREHDKRLGAGTMSKSGAECPCCGAIMTTEDIRLEGKAGRLGATMTVVAVEGTKTKGYHLPTDEERLAASSARNALGSIFAAVPHGIPDEPTPKGGNGAARAFSVDGYGLDTWSKLFTPRQLVALGTFVLHARASRAAMMQMGYPPVWAEAIEAYLALSLDRLLDFANNGAQWKIDVPTINHSFVRFALSLSWDYAEGNPIGDSAGSYLLCYERICSALQTYSEWHLSAAVPHVVRQSAIEPTREVFDVIVTDPPYYDAIPYSDLMDFFYVWLRRIYSDSLEPFNDAFKAMLAPKWDHNACDGELIDDSSRFNGDKAASKKAYEDGMAHAFQTCHAALDLDGRLVIVFAHKQPDAWETLVSAIIRAGFVVDGSWPIQTEQVSRMRAIESAALSSSVWLVCKKRPTNQRPGWDNAVLDGMRHSIVAHLRDFWDAGIRGPDFVWAATGPALEAYSQYPVVKKADEPGQVMTVAEFLAQARRIVVEFVVGRVLGGEGGGEDSARDLDAITTYYLLHRHDFKMEAAPVGPCILYAVSCGLSDSDLTGRYDLLARGGGSSTSASVADDADEDAEGDEEESGGEGEVAERSSGATVKLKAWDQRKRVGLAADGDGRPVPLIDRTHRLMQLWRAGDVHAVDEYLDTHGLRRSTLFHHLLQALIELAAPGSEERSLLESISNHVNARSTARVEQPALLPNEEE